MRMRIVNFIVLATLLTGGTLVVSALPSPVAAQGVAALETKLAKEVKALSTLQTSQSKAKSEQSKNRKAQAKARKDGNVDLERKLKTEGNTIGRELNTLASSISSKLGVIASLRHQIRSAARGEVASALNAAKGNAAGQEIKKASNQLSSWTKAFKAYRAESHQQENLPRRPTTDSKARAKREKTVLEGLISRRKQEAKECKAEAQSLAKMIKMKIKDKGWESLKSALTNLEKLVNARAKALESSLKSDQTRLKELEKHLK